jgi:beta-glucosidase
LVVEHLGEWLEEYFILNEPWCSSFLSYYWGIHAPGKQHESDKENLRAAVWAAHHLLLAQGLAFRTIKDLDPEAKVSTCFNVQPAYAPSLSPQNVLAAQYGDGAFNSWFFDPLYTGRYPEQMVELYGEDTLPPGYTDDMELIKIGDKLHALGINYYTGALYRPAKGALPIEEIQYEGGPTNHLNWPIFEPPYYAEGLYDILQQVYYSYRAHGLKRMYITENGIALDTSWDDRRIDYISKHLRQLYKTLLRGIPVEAYFAWALIDNYEWAEGYSSRSSFGLIHVDRPSLKRSWKKSAYWYRDLMKTHTLSES